MDAKLIRYVSESFDLNTRRVTIEIYEYGDSRDYVVVEIQGVFRMKMSRGEWVQLGNIMNRVTERMGW